MICCTAKDSLLISLYPNVSIEYSGIWFKKVKAKLLDNNEFKYFRLMEVNTPSSTVLMKKQQHCCLTLSGQTISSWPEHR